MDQQIRRVELIKMLLEERPEYQEIDIPASSEDQQRMLRSLMNIRLPGDISDGFIKIQDEYLAEAWCRIQYAGHYQVSVLAADS